MTEPDAGAQLQWAISADGRRAIHACGLAVSFIDGKAVPDPEAIDALRDRVVAELGSDRHFGAELYRLTTQAERLLALRSMH